jgi:DNA polymerase III subunit delta
VHFIERAADWDEVRASAASLSLFGARRVLEIRLTSGRAGVAGGRALAGLITARAPDLLLLILAPRLDREAQGADWVAAAEKHGVWVPIWPVEAGRLVGWLKSRSARLGLEVEPQALELLAAHTEGNLLAAHQELTKLALIAPAGRVTSELVGASVADSARFDVFQLGEAVLAGQAPRALRMLAGLRAEGSESTLVLWALVRAMRELWRAPAGETGAAPAWQRRGAAVTEARRRAPGLPFAALSAHAQRIDRMIKGRASGDAWDEMALWAAELCAVPGLMPAGRPRLARA